MTINRIFGLVLVLTLTGISVSVSAADIVVRKDMWLSDMRNLLPSMFCIDGSYFRECFETNASVCHSTATAAAESCLRQFEPQIPEQLHQPDDGGLWGRKIGTCAGTVFEATLKKSRVNNAKCNNPALWK